ncbi:MAG: T9SS type A sorting domain-containing protein [Bacteroidetes bacterium]|nr:T9SS type A sorting domain-containing protein [Bacteroidota bacterium]
MKRYLLTQLILFTSISISTCFAQNWYRKIEGSLCYESIVWNDTIYTLADNYYHSPTKRQTGLILYKTGLDGSVLDSSELILSKEIADSLPTQNWNVELSTYGAKSIFIIDGVINILAITNLNAESVNRPTIMKFDGKEIYHLSFNERKFYKKDLKLNSAVQINDKLYYVITDEYRSLYSFENGNHLIIQSFSGYPDIHLNAYLQDTLLLFVQDNDSRIRIDKISTENNQRHNAQIYNDPVFKISDPSFYAFDTSLYIFYKNYEYLNGRNPNKKYSSNTKSTNPMVSFLSVKINSANSVTTDFYNSLFQSTDAMYFTSAHTGVAFIPEFERKDVLTYIEVMGQPRKLLFFRIDKNENISDFLDLSEFMKYINVSYINPTARAFNIIPISNKVDLVTMGISSVNYLFTTDGLSEPVSGLQIRGCTDSSASNFNPQANVNDGSCVYQTCLNNEFEFSFNLQTPIVKSFNPNISANPSTFIVDIKGTNSPETFLHKKLIDVCKIIDITSSNATYRSCHTSLCLPIDDCYKISLIDSSGYGEKTQFTSEYRLDYNQAGFINLFYGSTSADTQTMYFDNHQFYWDSCILDASLNSSSEEFICYPNPADDYILVKIPISPHQDDILQIFNVNGASVIYQSAPQPETRIDISYLDSGIYFLEYFNSQTGKRIFKKIIVR